MENNELTPSQKRERTMIDKYGDNWRQILADKAAKTYRERTTPEQRSERAANAGRIGGAVSPTRFKTGDERAINAGKSSVPHSRKKRA